MDSLIRVSFPQDKKLYAEISLPGSKSISNRLLILNFLAHKKCTIFNRSEAEDTRLLHKNLDLIEKNYARGTYLDCHHGGAPFRFLLALLSITPGRWTLDGSERLRERPHAELVSVLKQLGADIQSSHPECKPPFTIKGTNLRGGEISINASLSSQFISALMLVAPYMDQGLTLHLFSQTVSESYIHMTAKLMQLFGIDVGVRHPVIFIPRGKYSSFHDKISVESDWASASYWYELLALSAEGKVYVEGLSFSDLQGDAKASEIFSNLGIETLKEEQQLVLVKKKNFRTPDSFSYDFINCPDLALAVAVTCAALKIPSRLTGLRTLNRKESERIKVLHWVFKGLGIRCEQTEDELMLLEFPHRWKDPGILNPYNDHRMALSFSGLSVLFPFVEIENPEIIEKSYPSFWKDLINAGFRISYL